jgi:hypothetical protein
MRGMKISVNSEGKVLLDGGKPTCACCVTCEELNLSSIKDCAGEAGGCAKDLYICPDCAVCTPKIKADIYQEFFPEITIPPTLYCLDCEPYVPTCECVEGDYLTEPEYAGHESTTITMGTEVFNECLKQNVTLEEDLVCYEETIEFDPECSCIAGDYLKDPEYAGHESTTFTAGTNLYDTCTNQIVQLQSDLVCYEETYELDDPTCDCLEGAYSSVPQYVGDTPIIMPAGFGVIVTCNGGPKAHTLNSQLTCYAEEIDFDPTCDCLEGSYTSFPQYVGDTPIIHEAGSTVITTCDGPVRAHTLASQLICYVEEVDFDPTCECLAGDYLTDPEYAGQEATTVTAGTNVWDECEERIVNLWSNLVCYDAVYDFDPTCECREGDYLPDPEYAGQEATTVTAGSIIFDQCANQDVTLQSDLVCYEAVYDLDPSCECQAGDWFPTPQYEGQLSTTKSAGTNIFDECRESVHTLSADLVCYAAEVPDPICACREGDYVTDPEYTGQEPTTVTAGSIILDKCKNENVLLKNDLVCYEAEFDLNPPCNCIEGAYSSEIQYEGQEPEIWQKGSTVISTCDGVVAVTLHSDLVCYPDEIDFDPTCECKGGEWFTEPQYVGQLPTTDNAGTNVFNKCINSVVNLFNNLVCYAQEVPDPECECRSGDYVNNPEFFGQEPTTQNAGTIIFDKCKKENVLLRNDLVCYEEIADLDPTCECIAGAGYVSFPQFAGDPPIISEAGTQVVDTCNGSIAVTLNSQLVCYEEDVTLDPPCECLEGAYSSVPQFVGDTPIISEAGSTVITTCDGGPKAHTLNSQLVCYVEEINFDPTCECQAGDFFTNPQYVGQLPTTKNAGTNVFDKCLNRLVNLFNNLVCYAASVPDPTCECQAGDFFTNPQYQGQPSTTTKAGTILLNKCTNDKVVLKNNLVCYEDDIAEPTCACRDGNYVDAPEYVGQQPTVAKAGTSIFNKCTNKNQKLKLNLTCYEELTGLCLSGSADVPANRGSQTSLGISVTNQMPFLTIFSSGVVDLICNNPNRPPAPRTAPQALEVFVGGTLLSFDTNFSGLTALRGAVTVRIRDSRHSDNCGSYFVVGQVCEL